MNGPLDPELHQEVTARAKVQLRKRMRALRGGHSTRSLATRSEKIVERLLEEELLTSASSVALFWPMEGRGEIDLRPLDSILRQRDCTLFYPFMDPTDAGGFQTGFREVRSPSELVERGQKFLEPPRDRPAAEPGQVDLVLVPALAGDARGHRIGYGAGYYDATLGDVCPPAKSLIVAYHFQLMAELPTEPHDRACDGVLTDQSTYLVDRS